MKKIIYVIILCLGCSLFQTRKEGVKDYLPRETDVPGWKKISETIIKDTGNPDIKEKGRIVYRSFSNSEITITVSILHASSMLNAFMFFTSERRKPGARNFTKTSFYSDRGFFYFTGRYYIAIKGNNSDDRLTGEIKQFTRALKGIFRDYEFKDTLPSYINLFAGEKDDYSLLFKKDCLTISSASFNFFSRYINLSEKKYEIFFSPMGGNRGNVFFNNLLSDKSRGYTFSQGGDHQVCFRKYKEKYLFVSHYKGWIFGVLDADSIETGQKIVKQLYNTIKGL